MRLWPETHDTAPCTVFSAMPLRRYSTSGCQFGMGRAKLGAVSSRMGCRLYVRRDAHHKIAHVFHDSFRIVIIEIKPKHEPVLRIEPLPYLLNDCLRVSDESVVGRALHLRFIERALERAPV